MRRPTIVGLREEHVKCCERAHSKICPKDPTNAVILAIFMMASFQLYAGDTTWELEIPWQPNDIFEDLLNPAYDYFQNDHELIYTNEDSKKEVVSPKRALEKKSTKKERKPKRKKSNDEDTAVKIETPASNIALCDPPKFKLNTASTNNIRIKASDCDASFAINYLDEIYGNPPNKKYTCCFDNCDLITSSRIAFLTPG